MTNERLTIICENLIEHLSESLGHSNGEELYNILSNGIGMTDNEIDQLCENFDDDVQNWAEGEGYDIFEDEEEDEEIELPDEAIVELSELDCCLNDEEEIKDAVVDFLTDEFGFCINGCNISLEDEGLAKVTNIDWDTEE